MVPVLPVVPSQPPVPPTEEYCDWCGVSVQVAGRLTPVIDGNVRVKRCRFHLDEVFFGGRMLPVNA